MPGRGLYAEVKELPDCDLCTGKKQRGNLLEPVLDVTARYDAKTMSGWAFMCESHFHALMCSLGTGCGQFLITSKELDDGTYTIEGDVPMKKGGLYLQTTGEWGTAPNMEEEE